HPIRAGGEPLALASAGALTAEHILAAADGGVSAVIHPGGAAADKDAAEAADARNVTLVSSGVRHFKH
ncbi:MAG: bifunctional phosphoribosylaminoimidazolecarboxamide formyltransferase/IMP cyclohydrolase, partial [Elusimicrobiota bacterium]